MQDKDVNMNVVRSVWKRMKKGHIKARDLQPQKDVKGGSGVAGIIRTSSSITEASLQIPHDPPLSACETPRARWLPHLKAARDARHRKSVEVLGESEGTA